MIKKKNNFLRAVPLHIETGGINIAVLNAEQAKDMDVKHLDRVMVKHNSKSIICSVDITHISVKKGEVGLFVEPWEKLSLKKKGSKLRVVSVPKPLGLEFIKSKLEGEELNKDEIFTIIKDIVDDALSDVELTAFITGSYCRGLSMEETYNMTMAMVETGDTLKVGKGAVFDKHSIGGVPGNRVTMILIPIISSTGLKIPKTSSRAITSPAGTADTMEVFAPVDLSKNRIESIVKKVGGCIVWGGSFNLAPADDKIIKVEKPLSIDAEGQLLASIMAKKLSVGSNHVIIDLPIGPGTKVPTHEKAEELKEDFVTLGDKLGIKVDCIESNGSQPCGNGIGPALEARDVLKVLTNAKDAPQDLKNKSLLFAGTMLEMAGKAEKGKGSTKAAEILESGKAYEQFKRIVKAQGGNPDFKINNIKVGSYTFSVKSDTNGIVTIINNKTLSDCARAAGAPYNKGAGVFINVKLSDFVKAGDALLTVYSESRLKLERARKVLKEKKVFTIQ
ncbi:AMP phosphorylase [archaeon CG_4_10_14_0_2_um_filter_Archaea_38_6]|nr:MAG: AMP phosphorylase [archaeon CG07_land_8_20_14_0_80_38_8]PIU89514.1 MAG: AMP phosphorylase [archaeon CG06_land_8_20_14_3_00_37_11]PJA23096.1 MAG: AMP phosphorylase [archaeon CG_4_10_14_0_2_um_filter_Archaea_38_6]